MAGDFIMTAPIFLREPQTRCGLLEKWWLMA
jgi:hypothetical protein